MVTNSLSFLFKPNAKASLMLPMQSIDANASIQILTDYQDSMVKAKDEDRS